MWCYTPTNKAVTIDALYKYAQAQGLTLLPTEDFDFWQPYEAAYQKFDRYFYQRFRAFKVQQEYDADTSDEYMLQDWKQIIDAHLFLNAKRYSELYRVQVLAADAYDVVNNYDLHEVSERKNTGTVTDALGQRQDSLQHGALTRETTYGGHTDSTQYGSRTDSNSTTLGAQTSSSTDKRSAFNSSSMQDVAGGSISNGSRSDSASLTTGSHTDTATIGGHTDTSTEQARTDTSTTGAQSNQRTDNLQEDYTLRRYGNIGVQTPADVIGGHIDLWAAFRFYQMIFNEIAEEYLVIDVDFDFAGSTASGSGGGGDAELLAAIRALSAQLTAAQTSINDNVDSAETNIRGEIDEVASDVYDAETNIRRDITTSTTAIRGDITDVTTQAY